MDEKFTAEYRSRRNYEIAYRYHRLGEHYLDLADRFKLSPRHIHRIVQGRAEDNFVIPRSLLLEELLPGLNALFGIESEEYIDFAMVE